jgi:sugar phosphate isomerase/epimerase
MASLKTSLIVILAAGLFACSQKTEPVMKVSDEYPGVKLGFSTQNFQKALPLSTENLKEILDFASSEGYAFIELRDPSAELGEEDCRIIASYAKQKNIEVIYEMHRDLFDPEFREVFDRAVRNTAIFGKPGILRSILSFSEFAGDPDKTGWTREELEFITSLADSCAASAKESGVQFILENIMEPWFSVDGDLGLDAFFSGTSKVGLQFDTANPFLSSNRRPADPARVAGYMGTLKGRWFTTHLKSGADDAFQPVLRENFMPFDRVFSLMSENGVHYAALELLAADSKEECFGNHRKSIEYLAELGIIGSH